MDDSSIAGVCNRAENLSRPLEEELQHGGT